MIFLFFYQEKFNKNSTQIVLKLKNLNCDETQKFKLWSNLRKIKAKVWQNRNCDKTQIVTKVKSWQNSNCDKTQIVREN